MPVVQERKSYLAKSSIVSRFLNDLIKSKELPYGAVTYLKQPEPHMVIVGMVDSGAMLISGLESCVSLKSVIGRMRSGLKG